MLSHCNTTYTAGSSVYKLVYTAAHGLDSQRYYCETKQSDRIEIMTSVVVGGLGPSQSSSPSSTTVDRHMVLPNKSALHVDSLFYSGLQTEANSGFNVAFPIVQGSVSTLELNALHELYNATNGDGWKWRSVPESGPKWNFATTEIEPTPAPCKEDLVWQGLNCTCPFDIDDFYGITEFCVITSLSLNNYGLNGTLPASIGHLTQLSSLQISSNRLLTGHIPPLDNVGQLLNLKLYGNMLSGPILSLDNLSQLQFLDLGLNLLTGSIPTLDSLGQLQYLYLDDNALNGSIPSLAMLGQLLTLYLNNNELTGSIPSLDRLNQLLIMNLAFNKLCCSIPALDSLNQIQFIYLSGNGLSGSIPSLDNLSKLQALHVYSNALTGSIPSLNNVSQLLDLVMHDNFLSSSIPSLNSLSQLRNLSLYSNVLTGSIPDLENLGDIIYMYLDNNYLSDSIPSLGNLSKILELFLNNNALADNIPSVESLSELVELQVNNNYLTGSIPTLNRLHRLTFLHLSTNSLSGCIPSLDTLRQLQVLALHTNALTCTIPPLSSLNKLRFLHLYDNHLIGSIPTLTHSYLLEGLLLENNRFTGKLNNILNPKTQLHLNTIQLSSNQFSGTIPEELFEFPVLQTFAIVSNCIKGPLPVTAICNSASLRSLLFDGLHTATSCSAPLLGNLIPRLYILDSSAAMLANQLDPCFFSMPMLNTLHMSGNGLTGSIPDVSTNITNLVLSHNELIGTIPKSLQNKMYWNNLDLSYNRLTGVLENDFTTSFENDDRSSISLNLNRFSGRIPPPLHKAINISILTGNIFPCKLDGSNTPVHDSDRSHYTCGSNTFNVPYYVYLSVLAFLLVLMLEVKMFRRKAETGTTTGSPSTLLGWLTAHTSITNALMDASKQWRIKGDPALRKARLLSTDSTYQNIQRLNQVLTGIRSFALRCWAFILLILVPLYIICGLFSSTYTYRYAWTVSTSFLSGRISAGVLFFTLTVYTGFVSLQYTKYVGSIAPIEPFVASTGDELTVLASNRVRQLLTLSGIILVNAIVVGLSNVGFVWVTLYHGTQFNLFAVQICLASVKYVWNSTMLRATIHWFASIVIDINAQVVVTGMTQLELYLAMFNNVIVPCFIVAVLSPECYYSFFVPPSDVTASYEYEAYQCGTISCHVSPAVGKTSFDPPFSYSYQCSAAFTTHYATAFLYLCIVTGILVPSWQLFLMFLYSKQLDKPFSVSSSLHTISSHTETGADTVVSPLPVASVEEAKHERGRDTSGQYGFNDRRRDTWLHRVLSSGIVPRILKPVPLVSITSNKNNSDRQNTRGCGKDRKPLIFNNAKELIRVMILIALLLTFGTVFPPLGFAIVVTLVVNTYFTQFKLTRFILMSKQAGLTEQLMQVDKECSTYAVSFGTSMWMLATISCCFYALTLFDTLGDTDGFASARNILCAMALLPGGLFLMWRVRHYFAQKKEEQSESTTIGREDSTLELGRLSL